jgi:hypothetical protein
LQYLPGLLCCTNASSALLQLPYVDTCGVRSAYPVQVCFQAVCLAADAGLVVPFQLLAEPSSQLDTCLGAVQVYGLGGLAVGVSVHLIDYR